VPDASPPAARLPTPSWLDARLVLGVVLVLLAVVAGARIFAAAGHYTTVYVARHPLVPGEHLAADDLAVGQVRFRGEGSGYVAAGSEPIGYVVTRYVGAGELVPVTALAGRSAAAASRLVAMPVEPGHLPSDLGHGDLVDLYVTPKSGSEAKLPIPTAVVSSVPVDSYDDGSRSLSGAATASVVLVVPRDQVVDVVRAIESGTVDLVRVPATAAAQAPSPASTAAPASRGATP
jgi:SAF domain